MTRREQEILALIRDEPMLPQQAIAQRLGISRSAVAGHIMHLTKKGLIKGRGYVVSDAPFVAAVGGANIDIHGKSADELRSKDSNPGSVHLSAGGVARNIAENLARLGVDARLISAVGDDHYGKMLTHMSHQAGVNTQSVHVIASAPTATYLSVLDNSGEMQIAIADMRVIDELSVARLQTQKAMLEQAAVIVIDTNLSDSALSWLTSTFAERPVFADTVSTSKAANLAPYLASVHTLKCSKAEAEALTGLAGNTYAELRTIAGYLHEKGVTRVFITRGSKAVFYSTGESQGLGNISSRVSAIENVSGAGDAFLAGLVYAWLNGMALPDTLDVALAAADITLSHQSSSSPALSLNALDRSLENTNNG